MRGAFVATAVVLALAGLVGADFGLVANRSSSGQWLPTATPPRLHYCGRRYYPTNGPGQVTGQQLAADAARTDSLEGSRTALVSRVGTASVMDRRTIWASVQAAGTRARLGLPCALRVYLQLGPDSYLPYGLSGGP